MEETLVVNGFDELTEDEMLTVEGGGLPLVAAMVGAVAAAAYTAYELGKAVGSLAYRAYNGTLF
jgi:lactobin A/cerein 7B family class IIb bacteriocin